MLSLHSAPHIDVLRPSWGLQAGQHLPCAPARGIWHRLPLENMAGWRAAAMHAVALLLLVAGPGPAGCSPIPIEAGLEQPGLSLGADMLAIDSPQELPALVLRDEQAAQQEFAAAAQGVQAGGQDQPGAAAAAGAAVELEGGWWDAEGEDEGAVEGEGSGASSGRGLLAVKRLAPSWRGRFDSKYNLGYFAPYLKLDKRYSWSNNTTPLLQVITDPTKRARRQPVLRALFPQGSWSPSGNPNGGTLFYAYPHGQGVPIAYQGARLEYDVYFPKNWEWVKGGKLPGLAGGPTGCGGGASAYDCWSVRIMWRRQGMGEAYVYVPGGEDGWQAPDFCNQPPQTICDWHAGVSLARGAFNFTLGAWHKMGITVLLNEQMNTTTGTLEITLNGQRVIYYGQLNYRTHPGINVDSIYYSLWYGGSDTTWGPSKQTQLLVKNHRIYSLDPPALRKAAVKAGAKLAAFPKRQRVEVVDTGEPEF